jgi:lipoate-protein ligase A
MIGQWRLVYDAPMSGAQNMSHDETILRAVAAGDVPPTLRISDWNPPCLSLGYAQRASDVDFERAAGLGWTIVRRPTGGRAVLHIDEMTYSVTVPENHPLAKGNVVESYRRISQALLAALESIGLTPRADQRANGKSATGTVCFETPSHYEVTVAGRKLIGSAQVRRFGGVLQHGAFPLRGDLGRICDVLVFPDETAREEARIRVREHATTLAEVMGGESVSWHTLAEAVMQGFATTFNIEFVEETLSQAEVERADQLYHEVYANDEWTRRR